MTLDESYQKKDQALIAYHYPKIKNRSQLHRYLVDKEMASIPIGGIGQKTQNNP